MRYQVAVYWTAAVAALALILWVTGWDHQRAMKKCMERMSRPVCVYQLR